MYAVIKSGGKQYRVSPGQKVRLERLTADVGAEIDFGDVLMVGDDEATKVGAPKVAGASVKGKVTEHGKADKVRIFKLRRRKHYQKSQGHRQQYTVVEITSINA